MLKDKSLLILDCDGVLVRSEKANVAYYNHILRHFGKEEAGEGERDKIRLFHTLSTPQVIDAFFEEDLRAKALEYSQNLDYFLFAPLIEPEPGWKETLFALSAKMKICVATNRGHSARAVIESAGLSPFVEKIFTIRDVKRPKPAPDLIELALESFSTKPENALYVGDSEIDRSAAAGAGVDFVGFRLEARFFASEPSDIEVLLK